MELMAIFGTPDLTPLFRTLELKKILSYADNLGAKYVVLVGARDIENGKVTVKNMESGEQELIDLNSISQEMNSKIEEVIK